MTREIDRCWLMQKPPLTMDYTMTKLARVERSSLFVLLIALISLGGCTIGKKDRSLFKLLSPDQTGVTFANTITTSDSLNVQTDPYVYNGAGVAIGDIDLSLIHIS